MIFIMEDSLQDFNTQVHTRENAGSHVITGSFYIKALETDIPVSNKQEMLADISYFYAVTLEKDGITYTLALENDPDTFFNTINIELDKGVKPVIGSIYFESLRQTGFVPYPRLWQTWYCCFMT